MFKQNRKPAASGSEAAASSVDVEKRPKSRLNKLKSFIPRHARDSSSSGLVVGQESGPLTVQHVQGVSTTPASVPGPTRPISGLWDEAYTCLNLKEPDLINDYGKCLMKRPKGTALAVAAQATAAGFFGMSKVQLHEQMIRDINSRIEYNESKHWKTRFLGHELQVKDLIKPVVGIMEAAKQYVGVALEASPIGSAAWGGVCLLTQVSSILQAWTYAGLTVFSSR